MRGAWGDSGDRLPLSVHHPTNGIGSVLTIREPIGSGPLRGFSSLPRGANRSTKAIVPAQLDGGRSLWR